MRLSELRNAKVRTLDGEMLGRVHEVHVEKGRVTAVTCGPGSLIERLTARKHGRRIPWECVCKIDSKQIIVDTLNGASVEERGDYSVIKEKIRKDLKRFIFKQTAKRPFILPVIMEI